MCHRCCSCAPAGDTRLLRGPGIPPLTGSTVTTVALTGLGRKALANYTQALRELLGGL
jgi:hypothetical protein